MQRSDNANNNLDTSIDGILDNSLTGIPLDIKLLILTQLNPISLYYLSLINVHFHKLITLNDALWKTHFLPQFSIDLDKPHFATGKRKNNLFTLFTKAFKTNYPNLDHKQKEAISLVCANDLYTIETRKIEFDLSLLEKENSQGQSLLSLIRKQKNHDLNRYIFNNIFLKTYDCTKIQFSLIKAAIKLDQDHDYLLSFLASKNINEILIDNQNILCYAVTENAHRVVNLLLRLGANPNPPSDIDLCPPIHTAAKMGQLEALNELLAHKDIQVDALYKNKFTALYMAACEGHTSLVEALLKKSANVNGKRGYHPLYIAMDQMRVEVFKCLLKYNANIFINTNGCSLFYNCVRDNHLACLKLLVEHCKQNKIKLDLEAIGPDDSTALYVAAQNGNTNVCRFLLEQGAKRDCKFHQQTPLSIASYHGHYQIVKVLCTAKLPKNFTFSVQEICLAASNACENGYYHVAEYLLKKFDFDETTQAKNNMIFLHYACQKENLSFVKLLLNNGFDVDQKNSENITPLYIAVSLGNKNIVDLLLKNHANPNGRFENGNTLLNILCANINRYKDCLAILRSLIKAGADVSLLSLKNIKIINHRLASVILPPLTRLAAEDLSQVVNVPQPYGGNRLVMINALTEFITYGETIFQSCKDARLCLSLLKNISTPFGFAVILYSLLARSDTSTTTYFFSSENDTPFNKYVTKTLGFQSTFTAKNSLYTMIFASLGCNNKLLNVLKELVIRPITLDAVNMCTERFQTVIFCLNLFEAEIKKAPILNASVEVENAQTYHKRRMV